MSTAYSKPKPYLKKSSPDFPDKLVANKPTAGKKSYRWNRNNYSRLRRRIDIWTFVFILLFKLWRNGQKWTYGNGYTAEKRAVRRRLATTAMDVAGDGLPPLA